MVRVDWLRTKYWIAYSTVDHLVYRHACVWATICAGGARYRINLSASDRRTLSEIVLGKWSGYFTV